MIVIQARLGSQRLPGKVLLSLAGRPVLSWVIQAALDSGVTDRVVVATTDRPEDDAIVECAIGSGVEIIRGSSDDVQSRFIAAVEKWESSFIVRLTADCPLVDPRLISDVVKSREATEADYVSNFLPRTLPRGLDVEVFRPKALLEARDFSDPTARVHVTPCFYRNPSRFSVRGITYSPDASKYRVTLDTKEDWALLTRINEDLGSPPYAWQFLVEYLESNPEAVAINARVRHKELHER